MKETTKTQARNIPILFIGPPGVGKTASVRSRYEYCEVVLLSTMTEEDVAGLPYREGSSERRTTPPFIERLIVNKNKKSCLFLDELDKARREVADTLLTLITHPEHFGIPETVDIIAAANPPEWGGGDGISDAMLSRFSVCQFNPDLNYFTDVVLKQYTSDTELVSLFINGDIPLLDHTGEGLSRRITSPRTLEMAMQIISNVANDLYLNKETLIKGLLTPVAASRLLLFATNKSNHAINSAVISRIVSTTKKNKPFRIIN